MKRKIIKVTCFVLLGITSLILIIGCSTLQDILGWPRPYDSRGTAISQFLSNTRPQPGNPDSHYLLACYYQERDRHKEAIEEFKKVLLIDPDHVKAYNGMGVSYDLLGDFSMAIEYYNYALKLNPNLDYVYNNLGYSYLLQGDLDDAIAALKKAVSISNQDKRFHNNLGLAYGEKGLYDLALAEFKVAGDGAKAYHNMAQIYFKKDLLDEAKEHYATALMLNPSLTVVRTALSAADVLTKIFEPIPRKAEIRQLVVPDQPKEMKKIENVNASKQLNTTEMSPMEGAALKEVSFSYDVSKEHREPVIDVEEVKEVGEPNEMKKEKALKEKTMEASPVAQTNAPAPQKVNLSTPRPEGHGFPSTRAQAEGLKIHPEPRFATLPPKTELRAVEGMKKAKEIIDVSFEDKEDSITYGIVADGKIGDYDVFALDAPSRLVLDIWKMRNHYPKTGIWIENPFIRVVRIGGHPNKMRFVFDSLSSQLPPYQVTRMGHKLMASFGNIPQPYEPNIYSDETPSPKTGATSVATKTPFEPSHNGKLAMEISNGNGVNRMARMVGDYLERKGFRVTRLTKAENYAGTKIFHQKEYYNAVDQVAEQLPVFRSKEEAKRFDRANVIIEGLISKDLVLYYKLFEIGEDVFVYYKLFENEGTS